MDCKDLAIEKRLRLIEAGFPADRLRVAVVYSRSAGLHILLVAQTDDRGEVVLDSRQDRIVRWDKARYRWLSVQSADDPMAWFSAMTA
ncbi:transglutaminase-like cysteine peptidase [Sphingomonas sp.]|uniref:transglutaminase-like cysteine peptidase n=1 Tax=Sphingomonas sp. TaxID=28214 RepID=UPI002C7B9322|nr:transglutaminase-like cysteine peptidase [Sphingomonas sp.]HWK37089.1 transglutaminase-like cysteine peptidase [Sphingomonas sp.]